MIAVVALLVGLSALAWLGVLRRWSPNGWLLCTLFGCLVAIAVLLASLGALLESPIAVTLATCGTTVPVGLLAGLFFYRLLPARSAMRFFYHGAFAIFLGGIAILFPFNALWQKRLPPEANGKLSERYQGLATKFGLKRLSISIRGERAPMACVTSFSGDSASIVVSSGLNDMLAPEEMRFVIAHELAHHQLKHYPVRIMLAVTALAFYFLVAWLTMWRRDASDDSEPDGRREVDLFLRRAPLYLLMGLLAALGPLAYCRAQEAEADLKAAELTGSPEAGRAALEKLARALPGRRLNPLECLSSHPCLQKRIDCLR